MPAPTDPKQALSDVKKARAWARKHFNVGGPSGFFDPPTFKIDFEADRMVVYPEFFGRAFPGLGIEYRLKWIGKHVGWEGYAPLTGKPMCWLQCTNDPEHDQVPQT